MPYTTRTVPTPSPWGGAEMGRSFASFNPSLLKIVEPGTVAASRTSFEFYCRSGGMSTAKGREKRLTSLRFGNTVHEIREVGGVGDSLPRLGAGLGQMIHDLSDRQFQSLPGNVEGKEGVRV